MNLPETKKLKQIIALCRKMGVESIEFVGIKITLGTEPAKAPRKGAAKKHNESPTEEVETDSPTEQELLFWSTGALPEEQTQ